MRKSTQDNALIINISLVMHKQLLHYHIFICHKHKS